LASLCRFLGFNALTGEAIAAAVLERLDDRG
jgi:hypothetical protein